MIRSPIEMMVDKACGFDPSKVEPRDLVTLRCPTCKKEKPVDRDKSDPPGTAIVAVDCPDCNEGDFEDVHYYRADGTEIIVEGD